MSCKFSITYPGQKEPLIDNLRTAILQLNGTFEGDNLAGVFRGNTPLGSFSGRYEIDNDDINIDIEDKPFLIGCGRIEKEIRDYLERNR